MQKKIIALAVAGLMSGAAFAQSNVTVYGVADGTFDIVKVSGTGSTEPNHNRVSSNSSYLGFKGTEDLGNGMKAVFQLEGGVNTSSGAGYAFDRDTYVGLATNYGTFLFGNLTGPTRALGSAVDGFNSATGITANTGIIGKFGGMLNGITVDANGSVQAAAVAPARSGTQSSPFDTRWKNAVAYVSPTFSGFTVVGAYVANENKVDNVAATDLNTYGYDLGVKYANGPAMVGLTYNKAVINNQGGTPAGLALVDVETDIVRLAGTYDFGVVKVMALWEQTDVDATGFGESQDVWGLGLSIPVGQGKIIGQYYKAGDIGIAGSDFGATLYALGYEHSLSKRTILKAVYSHLDNDRSANYSFGTNGMGGVTAGDTSSGFQVGIRHSF
jgi:predicted porin